MKAFVSHSSKDKEFVLRLATDLRTREGIDAWLDEWEINPGARIPEELEKGLIEADVFILVLSPDSVNSQWVEYERQTWLVMQVDEEKLAKEESRPPRRRLIPVLYRDCRKPAFLQLIKHVRITEEEYEDGLKRLIATIRGEPIKPPLKDEAVAQVIPLPMTALKGAAAVKLVLDVLKCLLPSQFDEVLLIADIPDVYLPPNNVSQVQRAVAAIRYSEQKEEGISSLLNAIYKVAPHLRGKRS